MSATWRVVAVLALQSAVLIAMVAMKQWTLASGTPVALETAPVDPRSLFSGDYVRLSYRISRLRYDQLGGERNFRRHETIYVVLRPGERYWQAVSVHRHPPAQASGEVAIRGEVERVFDTFWDLETRRSEKVENVLVRYGVENYFVPEGEGRALERPAPDEKISIRVAVDTAGRAAIQAVLVNGRERYVERLF